jgi:hypothetical protein
MNSLPNEFLPHSKITSTHHQRLAIIYVRQSTPKQVTQNQESQQYQYRLQTRAQELGWTAERVRVIDSDLGFSGSEAAGRSGFQGRWERQRQDQLKRARYEFHQAQRQYDAVDPENRLVAAELERRWETKLQQLRQVEEDFHHFQQTPMSMTIPAELRNLFQQVSSRLPEL